MTSQEQTLAARVRAVFAAMQKDASGERFYFFALRTTPDGAFVGATAWTEEAHARIAAPSHRFAADSPFRDRYDAPLAGVATGKKLHYACFDALREFDGDRVFGKGVARSKLLINVIYDGMSAEQWLVNADRLNSRAVVARARESFRLTT